MHRKGLVTGIIVAGFGFGGFFFGLIATKIANPNNLGVNKQGLYPKEVADNVPLMLRILCAIWAMLVIISLFLIVPKTVQKTNNYTKASDHESFDNQGIT